jgi:hypothetical protein
MTLLTDRNARRQAATATPVAGSIPATVTESHLDLIHGGPVPRPATRRGALGSTPVTDVDEHRRPEPPLAADETATLLGFVDYQRATLAWKCAGLAGHRGPLARPGRGGAG